MEGQRKGGRGWRWRGREHSQVRKRYRVAACGSTGATATWAETSTRGLVCFKIIKRKEKSHMPHASHITLHTSHFTHHTSHLTPHTSHDTRHTSHITPHTSHDTRHTSHITPHTSHDTRHTSHLTLHRSHETPNARIKRRAIPLAFYCSNAARDIAEQTARLSVENREQWLRRRLSNSRRCLLQAYCGTSKLCKTTIIHAP